MAIEIENQKLSIKPCIHFLSRLKGMMFQKNQFAYGFYFPKCSSLHTFFMRQSIDIIMINANHQIIAYYQNVKPWKIIRNKNADACLEFSTGILKKCSIGATIYGL